MREVILQRMGSVPHQVNRGKCAEVFTWLFDEETLERMFGLVYTPYKRENFLQANFHQLVTTYYVGNVLGRVRPENGTLHNPYTKELRRIKWDVTIDVYAVGIQLKKLFGAQLSDFSMRYETEGNAHRPVLAVGFVGRPNITRPSTDPVVVKEGLTRVDRGTYTLESADRGQLKNQLLLYK